MYTDLLKLEVDNRPIKVCITGAAGHMGRALCRQFFLSPGFKLVGAVDKNKVALKAAIEASGFDDVFFGHNLEDLNQILDHGEVNVLVEATNSVQAGWDFSMAALKRKIHVVLMNAEVDLLLGPLLHYKAEKYGAVVTSDQGDQYGCLHSMANEIQLWGFEITMLGNIKGYLRRDATTESILVEAGKRRLAADSCLGQTDGTKLNIEAAILCNSLNLRPTIPGMIGPRIPHVHDVFDVFDFDQYKEPVVDYILGAEPGGGVFVIGKCTDPTQQFYLNYYKLHGRPPYYLFYRPYHLCHLETPRAIAKAYLYGKKVMEPAFGKVAEVFAHAKKDLKAGMVIERGIGCDEFYGMVDLTANNQGVPVALLEGEGDKPTLVRVLGKDELLTWDHVDFPEGHYLLGLYDEQRRM